MTKRNFLVLLVLFVFAFLVVGCGETEKPTYSITLATNGGEVQEKMLFAKSTAEINLPTCTKEGYELKGWFIDEAFKTEFTSSYELTSDITLYAKWEQLVYKVKFLVNDNVIDEQDVVYGASAIAPTEPKLEGYDFKNWSVDFTNVKANLEVKAEFALKEYLVKFMDGSNELASVNVQHGKDATAPTNTDKAGYTFKNWDKALTNIKGNTIINAVYEANQYAITFYDGESVLDLAPAKVTYGVATALPDFTKSGTIFDGWYDSNTFANKVTDLSTLTKDTSLYAKYYTIKYYDGSTEITTLADAKIEDGVLNVPAYEVDGFAFVGWYTDENYSLPLDCTEEIKSDLNLKALLVKIDYNGGSASWSSIEWGSNDPAKGIDAISTLPEEFEKDFYQFLSDSSLLDSESLGATMKALTWAEFSAVNPNHNGDPKRIWNDCTTNTAKDASDGYAALFLYESLEYNEETGKLTNVIGGFLGTEPYKTKYFNVMQHLVLMYNGKYRPKNYSVSQFGNSNAARELYAFLLDGWFYGTQGLQKDNSVFDAARKIIPTTTTGYTWDGTKLVAYTNKYEVTTDIYNLDTLFAVPVGTTKFLGWCIDKDCKTSLTNDNLTNRMTIYAKWETN